MNINRVRFHFRSLLVSEIKHYNVRVGCLTYSAVIPVRPLHDLVPLVNFGLLVQDALVPCMLRFHLDPKTLSLSMSKNSKAFTGGVVF